MVTSGPAKTDGQMMNCCNTPTNSDSLYKSAYVNDDGPNKPSGATYTTCYDPGLHGDETCPKDRNGNSIFACFPSVGEQIGNCRPACVQGHPQDFNFKLYNSGYSMEPNELPIAERGVELYENYGLNTNIRLDSIRFGNSSNIGSDASNRDEMTCASELGRKVSLFGNVNFTIATNKFSVGSSTNITYVGADKPISLGSDDVYYIFTVFTDYSAYNTMQRYRYFGNHGCIFTYGNRTFTYIHGKMNNLPEVGYTINEDSIDYYISCYWIFRTYFGMTTTHVYPESLRIVTDSVDDPINAPYNSPDCSDWKFGDATSAAPLFPLPWTHSYFQNGDESAWNCPDPAHDYNRPSNPFNCYGTGMKSFYIPPHMEITLVNYHDYADKTTGGVPDRTIVPSTPLRSEDSKYNNGVFPAYGKKSNLPSGTKAVTSNRDSPFDAPAGSIFGISVRIRQDDTFYNTYVQPANKKFAPEILLIPGITYANGFAGALSAAGLQGKLGNALQLITNANDFWSSKNPYWDGVNKVSINIGYNPGDVLYGSGDLPPTESTEDSDDDAVECAQSKLGFSTDNAKSLISKIGSSLQAAGKTLNKNKITDHISATGGAMARELAGRLRAVARVTPISLVVDTSAGAPVGAYRIKQFDVINGVYSMEWLYAIWYCAMNGRKVTYDPTTGLYGTPNCVPGSTNGCAKQCMLFRDDYTYHDTNSPASAADGVMQAYCGMRNISFAYFSWQQTASLMTNECSCMTQKRYCPVSFNPNCSYSASNNTTYITADMDKCTDQGICDYCSINVNQTMMALYGCVEDSNNEIHNFGDQCSGNTVNCVTVSTEDDDDDGGSTGGTEGGDPEPPITKDPQTFNWKLLLLAIVILLAVVVVAYLYRDKIKGFINK
jgi:hypothetical protein